METYQFRWLGVTVEGKIAVVRLNRPDVLNALNREMLAELDACFTAMASDEEVAGIILTGTGEKAFAAGADIRQLAELSGVSGLEYSRAGQAVFERIASMAKPVIAAVNGYCLGGGCELALACHFRFASENARFGQPEAKLGLIPGYGGTQRLARLVGQGRAMELILTGEPVSAAEAERIGLVNRVVPGAELLRLSIEAARKIIANGPLAVRLALETVTKGAELPLERALAFESAMFGLCCSSEDMKEGTAAFIEKRKAQFRGK